MKKIALGIQCSILNIWKNTNEAMRQESQMIKSRNTG